MKECEQQYLHAIRNDDEEAFEVVFRKYYCDLCVFCNQFTGDINLSKEIVQDLFVYLWENRKKLEIKKSLRAYLYNAAKNNAIRLMRSYQDIPIQDLNRDITIEIENRLEYDELARFINRELDNLPPQCRKIFLASRKDGLKYAEIAMKFGLSVKTVEAQMGKALKRFRLALKDFMMLFCF
ncbi:MAG: RNA polymerase sigma-70 factor [Bacteroidales bacterium]|nr:RNA polymerase sigma-70 factor [Bacteroidales bacterium]